MPATSVSGGGLTWSIGQQRSVSRDANKRITAAQVDAAIRALHGACPMGPRLSQSTVMIMLAAAEEAAELERQKGSGS